MQVIPNSLSYKLQVVKLIENSLCFAEAREENETILFNMNEQKVFKNL